MRIQYSEAYRAQQAYVADLERCLPQFMKDMSSIDSTPAPQEREEVSNEARYALITKAVSQDISAFSPGAAVPSPPSPLAALSSPPINEDGTSADLYITCFGHF